MEFSEKDTEHLKYLDTLSGKYTYCSRKLYYTFSGVFLCSCFLLAKLGIHASAMGILAGVYVLLMWLACYVPCSYNADEEGFTIVSGFVARQFTYSEVISVIVEKRIFGHRKNGNAVYENVLTVSTNRGMYLFHERVGSDRRWAITYRPESDPVQGKHIELIKLKEFITTRL